MNSSKFIGRNSAVYFIIDLSRGLDIKYECHGVRLEIIVFEFQYLRLLIFNFPVQFLMMVTKLA